MTNLSFFDLEQYKKKFEAIMLGYRTSMTAPDYTQASSYLHFAQVLDKIENRPTYIIDLFRNEFFFVSKRYLNLLGIQHDQDIDYDLFFNNLHPDDYHINLHCPAVFLNLLNNSAYDEQKNLKLLCDYRLKLTTGKYIRVVEQMIMLKTAPSGEPWLIMAICDISKDQNLVRNSGAAILNTKNQQVIEHFGDITQLLPRQTLTPREYEILQLIARGHSSKQIAEMLYVSINTINNHRRNLLAKTGCSNTFEAIKYIGV